MSRRMRDLAMEACEDAGLEFMDTERRLCERWGYDAIGTIGPCVELFLHYIEQEVSSDGVIKKPEAAIGGVYDLIIIDRAGAFWPALYVPKYRVSHPLIKGQIPRPGRTTGRYTFSETDSEITIIDGSIPDINRAVLGYIGLEEDECGDLMVPDDLEAAVKQYMHYKLISRSRNMDRKSVPHQEVEYEYQRFLQLSGSARGRMGIPSRVRMNSQVADRWHLRGRLPSAIFVE